jgi:lipopolysaccharide biosynthesis glycosyltransferase
MKAVFAITSEGNDFYTSMTRIAVASLRLSNPSMQLVVACDAVSDYKMKRSHDPLIEEVDDWLVVQTPLGTAGYRNRFVKTSLREKISGPFLFLDSDIFVRGDLSELFHLDTDIAGARNHSRESFTEQVWEQDEGTLDAMGWKIGNEVYINGGVIFYNDTEKAKHFGMDWHKRWLKSFEKRNNYRDQPALNSALHNIKPRLTVISDQYNAQFKISPWVARNALIWHYYASAGDEPHTEFESISKEIISKKFIDCGKIKKLAKHSHPWRRTSWIDDYIANKFMERSNLDQWESAWLRREFTTYLIKQIKSKLSFIYYNI